MSNLSHTTEKTVVFAGKRQGRRKHERKEEAKLFICGGTEILAYDLEGTQVIGRPSSLSRPDIPIMDEYVSKVHGTFVTSGEEIRFIAEKTTNGILFSDRFLQPGEEVRLGAGDELMIPSFSDNRQTYIHLIVATSKNRITFWEEISRSGHDSLTDLPGRDAFISWVMSRKDALRGGEVLVIAFMEVDDFRYTHDQPGHPEGDRVLTAAGNSLMECMSVDGIACRWGGDEFVFAFAETGRRRGNRFRQMKEKMAKSAGDSGMPFTVSIGYTQIRKDSRERMDKWIHQADAALVQAKERGKDQVCGYLDEVATDSKNVS